MKNKKKLNPLVNIISGKISGGKTTFTKKLAVELIKHNLPVGGIISEKVVSDSKILGYNLIDIETNESGILLRLSNEAEKERIGRFKIFAEGFERGVDILKRIQLSDKKIIIIDEVGVLELGDKGWSGSITEILKTSEKHLLITVREDYIEKVIRKWNLSEPVVFKVTETDYLTAANIIIDQVSV